MMRWVVAGCLLLGVANVAAAQPGRPLSVPPPGPTASLQVPILKDVGIDQHLDEQIPLDLVFSDHRGQDVRLGDLFKTRPVVLALVYYECPMLCTQVLNGLIGSLEALTFTAAREFDVVVVSIDPGETPALAAEKRTSYLGRYRRTGADAGMHFLTGQEAAIKRLAGAVGFRYVYDPAIDQYAHPAAITVLTPAGHVSRYLFGIDFAPKDLKFALMDASSGRIGTLADQAMLFCYHYDPETGKYGLVIMKLVRLGAALTLAGLGGFIVWSLRRERRREDHGGPLPPAPYDPASLRSIR